MKTILVNAEKCLQCGDCMIACHDEHFDNDWSPIAAPQGDSKSWIRIDEKEVASGRLTKTTRISVMCQQCGKADCVLAAGDDAVYKREDGIVIIDPRKAKGRKDIVDSCPFGAIYWNEALQLPQKCTMCAHLLDEGWKRPRCVTACPADALSFVDTAELTPENLTAPIEELKPELKCGPRVKYMNLPKPFVGGDVLAIGTDEPVVNMKVTATHQVTGFTAYDYTDVFGGFKIEKLEPGFYTIAFEADGYLFKKFKNMDLRQAVNMEEVYVAKVPEGAR